MKKTSIINISTDSETKKAIEDLYSTFGLTISDAVNIFFKKSLTQNGLPFSIEKGHFNPDTLAALSEVQEIKKNPHMCKSFDSIKALFEELDSASLDDDEV